MSEDEIKRHEDAMMAAFGAVLRAEDAVHEAKARQQEAELQHKLKRAEAETSLERAWEAVRALLDETGEIEVILPGAATDYRIARASPRESVVADPAAIPDEFCKIERKPKLKEIGEHLKGLRDSGLPLPNWASLQRGESKLGWKPVKKSTNHKERIC